jgi:hypothetical protein
MDSAQKTFAIAKYQSSSKKAKISPINQLEIEEYKTGNPQSEQKVLGLFPYETNGTLLPKLGEYADANVGNGLKGSL